MRTRTGPVRAAPRGEALALGKAFPPPGWTLDDCLGWLGGVRKSTGSPRLHRLDKAFEEAKHLRDEVGRFAAGGKAHVVTTHNPGTGETQVHHVGADGGKAREVAQRLDEAGDESEMHEVEVSGAEGQRGDALHVVHAADGDDGVDVINAHLDRAEANREATNISRAAWDESGPTRADRDRDEAEEDAAAIEWNKQSADDGDDQVEVDADGKPVRDRAGDLQWEHASDDEEDRKDTLDRFDEFFGDLYPGDERAPYPGLEAANAYFADAGDHRNVIQIHTHMPKPARAKADLFAAGGSGEAGARRGKTNLFAKHAKPREAPLRA